jgi:hypothetical protein
MANPNRTLVAADGGIAGLLALSVAADRRPGSGTVAGVALARSQADTSIRAVEAQTALLGIPLLPPIVVDLDDIEGELRRLIDASFLAVREHIEVLVDPRHGGPDHSRVVRIADAGVYASRLASLTGRPIRVETPYADLSDRQLADLAVDMDLPVWLCDWALDPSPERDRWVAVLKEAGWIGDPARPEPAIHIPRASGSTTPSP